MGISFSGLQINFEPSLLSKTPENFTFSVIDADYPHMGSGEITVNGHSIVNDNPTVRSLSTDKDGTQTALERLLKADNKQAFARFVHQTLDEIKTVCDKEKRTETGWWNKIGHLLQRLSPENAAQHLVSDQTKSRQEVLQEFTAFLPGLKNILDKQEHQLSPTPLKWVNEVKPSLVETPESSFNTFISIVKFGPVIEAKQ